MYAVVTLVVYRHEPLDTPAPHRKGLVSLILFFPVGWFVVYGLGLRD